VQILQEELVKAGVLPANFNFEAHKELVPMQPDDVVKDQISAKVEDGILTITMPKTEPKEKVTKAIEVS
jgi:HSP20 family molecular chaperone IbpA